MLFTLFLVIIFLSILVLVHELGHFLAARFFGLWVEEFGIGLPPRIKGKKIGETVWSINTLPFGGFVKIFGEDGELGQADKSAILGRSFISLPHWKRAAVLVSGVSMNFILGWLVLSVILTIGSPAAVLISEVQKNSPAEEAGLLSGDRIIGASAGGESLPNNFGIAEVSDFIAKHRGSEVRIKIARGGEKKETVAVPRQKISSGEGYLGVVLIDAGIKKLGLLEAIKEGFKESINVCRAVLWALYQFIIQVFSSGAGGLKFLTGPIGLFKITAESQGVGLIYVFQLFALVSLNLAVLNILPFPALDGGHLLFIFIEKIKGEPLSRKFKNYVNALGMALLLTLVLAVTIKDIIVIW